MLTFTVPLPPVSLRANSRAHWSKKKRDADEYSIEVGGRWGQAPYQFFAARLGLPWPEAHVVYTWRYCGVAPDHGNLGGNTKYLQDILCMAPKTAKLGYTRWHLGIVEDDKGLTCEYRMERMPHRTDECVLVTIERKGGEGAGAGCSAGLGVVLRATTPLCRSVGGASRHDLARVELAL